MVSGHDVSYWSVVQRSRSVSCVLHGVWLKIWSSRAWKETCFIKFGQKAFCSSKYSNNLMCFVYWSVLVSLLLAEEVVYFFPFWNHWTAAYAWLLVLVRNVVTMSFLLLSPDFINVVMTKGYMAAEHNENLSAVETSNLARRFVIEDCALRYKISLQMAEELVRNNVAVLPSPKTRPELEAMEGYSRRSIDRHGHRNSVDEIEEMVVDGCEERGKMAAHCSSEAERSFARTREELFHARKPSYYVGQPQVSSFVRTAAMMPNSGYSFAGRPPHFAETYKSRPQANAAYNPFVYPYYVLGYPTYLPPMAVRRHSLSGNKHSERLYSRLRDVPAKRTHGDEAPPETATVVRPEEEERRDTRGKNRLVFFPAGRSLFAARRNMDSSELVNSQETSLETTSDSRNSNDEEDIVHVNSCRPSVIVMQTSTEDSPRSSIHISETERGSPEYLHYQRVPSSETCHWTDDPEATDSDSTTTPPTSPLSFQSGASSDERFSSDSPRSYESNPGI